MPPVATTYTEVVPDARDYGRKLVRGLQPEIKQAERKLRPEVRPDTRRFGRDLSRGIAGPIRAAGAAIGGALVAGQLFQFGKDAVAAARESNAIARITEQRIKSTGRAANITAKQVGNLATAISNKTGRDDEAIQSGANLLLTFTGIRNELGKGNDIFNQATGAAVDLAAAMNNGEVSSSGMKSASIQLGKALNDPVKGITALTRVGVSFDAQTKRQITTLVEQGRTVDAQKIILAELRKEFGGTAEASATAADKLSVQWGNFQETVGNLLIPVLDRLFGMLNNIAPVMLGAAQAVGRRAGEIGRAILDSLSIDPGQAKKRLGGLGGRIVTGIKDAIATGDWSGVGRTVGESFTAALTAGADLSRALFDWFAGVDWLAAGKRAAHVAVPFIIGFANELIGALIDFAIHHPMDMVVFISSLIPVGRAAGILEKLLGRLPILGPLLRLLAGTGKKLEGPVFRVAGAIWRFFLRGLESAFPGVLARWGDLFVRLLFRLDAFLGRFTRSGGRIVRSLYEGLVGQRGLLTRGVGLLIRLLTAPFQLAGRWLLPRGRAFVRGFFDGLRAMFGLMRSGVIALVRLVTTPFVGAGRWLVARGRQVVQGLINGFNAMRGILARSVSGLVSAVGRGLARLAGVVAGPFRAAARLINAFLGGLDRVASKVGIRIPWRIPGFAGGGAVRAFSGARGSRGGFQAGGTVPGQGTGDKIIAALEPGEVVVPNREGDRRRILRDPTVRARLRGFVPGFQVGGAVGIAQRGAQSWRQIIGIAKSTGIPFTVVSTVRPGARTHATGALSYHATGQAVDFGGSAGNLHRLFNALVPRAAWRELIYSPMPFYIGRGIRRPISALNPITKADHWTHIHAALTGQSGPSLMQALLGPAFRALQRTLGRGLAGLGGGPVGRVVAAIARRVIGAVPGFLSRRAAAIVPPIGGAVPRGGLSAAEAWIIARESGGRTTAANPHSSAFGLGQLLLANRIHYGRQFGYSAGTTDYNQQLAMMRAYIADRYGSAEAAKAFWQSHGYYRHGGVVPARIFDGGGALPPRSATLAINRTAAWEPVGAAGPVVNVYLTGPVLGSTRTVARELAPELLGALKTAGHTKGIYS